MKRQAFLVLLIITNTFAKANVKIHKFLSIACEASNDKVIGIELCEITPNITLNISFDFVQPFNEVFVTVDTSVKSGKVYRQIYKTPRFDYCSFAKGVQTTRIFNLFRSVLNQIKIDSKLVHGCPYTGKLEIKELHVKDDSFFIIYATGIYRSVAVMSNNKDNLTLTFITEITTPNKFG